MPPPVTLAGTSLVEPSTGVVVKERRESVSEPVDNTSWALLPSQEELTAVEGETGAPVPVSEDADPRGKDVVAIEATGLAPPPELALSACWAAGGEVGRLSVILLLGVTLGPSVPGTAELMSSTMGWLPEEASGVAGVGVQSQLNPVLSTLMAASVGVDNHGPVGASSLPATGTLIGEASVVDIVARWEDASAPTLGVTTPELWPKVIPPSESVLGLSIALVIEPTVVSPKYEDSSGSLPLSEPWGTPDEVGSAMSMDVEVTSGLDVMPTVGRKPSVEARGTAPSSGYRGPFVAAGGDGASVLCSPVMVTGVMVPKEAEGTRRVVEEPRSCLVMGESEEVIPSVQRVSRVPLLLVGCPGVMWAVSLGSEMLLDTVLISVFPPMDGTAVLGPPPTEDKVVLLMVVKGSPDELGSVPVWASGIPGMLEATLVVVVETGSISVTLVLVTGSDEGRASVWLPACSGAETVEWKESPAGVSARFVVSGSPRAVVAALGVAAGRREEIVPCGLVSKGALEPGTPWSSTEVEASGREPVPVVMPAEDSVEVGTPAREDMVITGLSKVWLPKAEPTARLVDRAEAEPGAVCKGTVTAAVLKVEVPTLDATTGRLVGSVGSLLAGDRSLVPAAVGLLLGSPVSKRGDWLAHVEMSAGVHGNRPHGPPHLLSVRLFLLLG